VYPSGQVPVAVVLLVVSFSAQFSATVAVQEAPGAHTEIGDQLPSVQR
jgi:hypothetical protein